MSLIGVVLSSFVRKSRRWNQLLRFSITTNTGSPTTTTSRQNNRNRRNVVITNVIDLHCEGEPARVVFDAIEKDNSDGDGDGDGDGVGCEGRLITATNISGASMAEKRLTLMQDKDHIRKLLLLEPRGYPCQNANILFPSRVATYGFVILEQNRFVTRLASPYH
jgi:Proline racemase